MDHLQEERARELVEALRRAPLNSGLLVAHGTVVLRCPGAPFTDTPMTFDESDLVNAAALGLFVKVKMTSHSADGADVPFNVCVSDPVPKVVPCTSPIGSWR